MGLDHLLPPGLGPDKHIDEARRLPSPFAAPMTIDDDLELAVHCLYVFGPRVSSFRERQHRKLAQVLAALAPLRTALEPHRGATAKRVAATKDVALMSFVAAVLRWPDKSQAAGYLRGFRVIGQIEPTDVFRPIPPEGGVDLKAQFYGENALEEVAALERSGPPKDAETIWQLTQKDVEAGFCAQPASRRHMDARYGPGQWRPIHRFIVHQADGKVRMIDDGRRGGQNAASRMVETIRCIGIDFVPMLCAAFRRSIVVPYGKAGWATDWLQPTLGTDDLPDAFRGCHCTQMTREPPSWPSGTRAGGSGSMSRCSAALSASVRSCSPSTGFRR